MWNGSEKISQLWQKHYYDLFNCVKSNLFSVGNIDNNEHVIVNPQELQDAVMKLGDSKASGMDSRTAEHLKLASKKLYPLLAICFTGLLVHGILPDSILSVILVPVAGKLHSSENFTSIALTSILSKVLERTLLNSTS